VVRADLRLLVDPLDYGEYNFEKTLQESGKEQLPDSCKTITHSPFEI